MSKTSTGGNKKTSSKSDIAYFARYIAGKMQETHRDRRIKRHAKRMAKKAAHRAKWEARIVGKRAFAG